MRRSLYPNPDAVVYPSTQPPGFPCQMTTQTAARLYPLHLHGAWLNKEGTGNTDLQAGHFHRLVEGRVQPDPSDGHTHELTMLPCGVGAPRTVMREGGMPMELMGPGDASGGPIAAGLPPVQRPSMVPWVIGGVLLVAAVVGGVMLMREGEEG